MWLGTPRFDGGKHSSFAPAVGLAVAAAVSHARCAQGGRWQRAASRLRQGAAEPVCSTQRALVLVCCNTVNTRVSREPGTATGYAFVVHGFACLAHLVFTVLQQTSSGTCTSAL